MRLTEREVAAITAAAREALGGGAVVRLFASRVHDDLRGGDIDLHVEVDEGQADTAHAARFRGRLFRRIPEREIDLVLARLRSSLAQNIDFALASRGARRRNDPSTRSSSVSSKASRS